MENQAKNTCCASDLRIFVIAFLTAIIMIALYHFGTGYCRMTRRAKACPPPQPKMLVCVDAPAPQFGNPGCCCRMNKPFPGRHGEGRMMREGKHPMPHKGFHRPPMKGPKAPEAKEAPKAQEAPKAPKAQEAPAPAPAK